MARKYEIEITAKDKTQAAVNQVNRNFQSLIKGTALEEHHKRFSEFGEKFEAFKGVVEGFKAIHRHSRTAAAGVTDFAKSANDNSFAANGGAGAGSWEELTRGISSVNDNARVAAGSVAEVGTAAEGVEATGGGIEATAAALGGLGAAAGPVGLAVAAAGAALGELAKKGAEFAEKNASAGFGLDVLSRRIRVNAQDLQRYQIAGQHAGVSAEAMSTAFQGLSKTLEDAGAGRNQAAQMLIGRLGISVHRLKDGSIDTADAMKQLGAAMQGQNAGAQEQIASTFGAASALDFLIQKTKEQDEQLKEATDTGAIKTAKQIADETRLHKSMLRLDDAWKGFTNRLSDTVTIAWLQPTIDRLNWLMDILNGRHAFWSGHPEDKSDADAGFGAGPKGSSGGKPMNNPGNIRPTSGGGFMQYASAAEGLEAEARQLLIYRYRHGLGSIDQIIRRWAPPSENNTGAYIADVEKRTGYDRRAQLDFNDPAVLARFMGAQIMHEQGRQPFTQDQLLAAVKHEIEIHLHGAPPGTSAKTKSGSPNVTLGVRIMESLAGAPI